MVRDRTAPSPIIFAMVFEPFAEAIRLNACISDLKVEATEHTIGLYVDDVLLLLTDPLKSLPEVSPVIQTSVGHLSTR